MYSVGYANQHYIYTYIDDKPRMLASIVVSFGISQKNELCSGLAFTFER